MDTITTANIARNSQQSLADKLKERSNKLLYRKFDIEQLGGWSMFSKRLHEEYGTKTSNIYLGMVCPACKKNDFSLGWGTYKSLINCPDCNGKLGSFWSEPRTKYRFSQQELSLGVVAFNGAELIGFIWGFEKTIPTEDKPGFYIEMAVINKEYRNSILGQSGLYGMFLSIEKSLKELNYPYIFTRTFKKKNLITKWLRMFEYPRECQCSEDPSRILYKKLL